MLKIVPCPPVRDKPRKPRPDFPLFPHASGRWAKKVRGKFAYFGKVDADPKGEAALQLWLQQRDDLLAGRTPRISPDALTVRDLCNRYLTVKEQAIETQEITRRHFETLFTACQLLVDHFGKTRPVDDLASDDFESLRASLAKTRAAWALGGVVQKVRSIFKYAYEAGLIDKPVRYGPNFQATEQVSATARAKQQAAAAVHSRRAAKARRRSRWPAAGDDPVGRQLRIGECRLRATAIPECRLGPWMARFPATKNWR